MSEDSFASVADLRLRDFRPRPCVRRPLSELPLEPPAPIADAHDHLGRWGKRAWSVPDVGRLVASMDASGVSAIVNLDGMWGDELGANLDRYDRAYPGRFATFARWDPSLFGAGRWDELGRQAAASAAAGAKGLKIWKDLGLHLRDERGRLVMPDDARLDPVWDAVAAAVIPVTIHVADPIAFFAPLDGTNERLEELLVHRERWVGDRERFPPHDAIVEALESLFARRHDVTFVGAHVLCCAEDLGWVSGILDRYPNVYADTAARLSELGRVPRAARALLVRHADRFLFGTDAHVRDGSEYAVHRRFFETPDEAFPYARDADAVPTKGRWTISGVDLPPDVLRCVYAENARRLIPGLRVGAAPAGVPSRNGRHAPVEPVLHLGRAPGPAADAAPVS